MKTSTLAYALLRKDGKFAGFLKRGGIVFSSRPKFPVVCCGEHGIIEMIIRHGIKDASPVKVRVTVEELRNEQGK